MTGSIISLLVSTALLALHVRFLAPVLIKHGSSSAFDMAIALGVILGLCVFWSTIYIIDAHRTKKSRKK